MADNTKKVSVSEFERQVFELEEVKIVVRAPRGQSVPSYDYERKADKSSSVAEWSDKRLKPSLKDVEFEIVKGDGSVPHGRTKMETVRSSYKE